MKLLDGISSTVPLSFKSYELHPRYNIIKLNYKSMYFLMVKFRNFILFHFVGKYQLIWLHILVIMHCLEWITLCDNVQHAQKGLYKLFNIIINAAIHYYAGICVFIPLKIIYFNGEIYIGTRNYFCIITQNKQSDIDVYVALLLFMISLMLVEGLYLALSKTDGYYSICIKYKRWIIYCMILLRSIICRCQNQLFVMKTLLLCVICCIIRVICIMFFMFFGSSICLYCIPILIISSFFP